MRHSFIPTRPLLTAGALLIAAACGNSTGSSIRVQDSFSSNSLASYREFDLTQPRGLWHIANGQLVASGEANQNVLIRNDVSLRDGYVEADISAADDAGLVFRFQDAGNYYLLAVRDDSASLGTFQQDNIGFYRAVNGEFDWLAVGSVAWPRGSKRIRVEFEGPVIRVFFDGRYLGELEDHTYDRGGVGLRHMKHPAAPTSRNVYEAFAAGEL